MNPTNISSYTHLLQLISSLICCTNPGIDLARLGADPKATLDEDVADVQSDGSVSEDELRCLYHRRA